MFLYILLSGFAVMAVSLAGVFSVWRQVGQYIEKNLSFLVSFSAGVFLVVAYSLLSEVLEHAVTPMLGFIWFIIGSLATLVLFKFLPDFHHHHDEKEELDHVHSRIDVRRILISDGIHNIGDGVLLATSFAVSPVIGLVATISILVHEFVQEVSEFFVLRQAGLSVKRALSLNFLVSATILVGAIGGYFLLETFEALEVPLLGFAAGAFFIVVVHDLIPHSVRTSKTKTQHLKHTVWFGAGLVIMFLIGLLLMQAGLEHEHSGVDEHHDEEHYEHHDDHDH